MNFTTSIVAIQVVLLALYMAGVDEIKTWPWYGVMSPTLGFIFVIVVSIGIIFYGSKNKGS